MESGYDMTSGSNILLNNLLSQKLKPIENARLNHLSYLGPFPRIVIETPIIYIEDP
jgi:hypothetical protein